MIQTVDEMADYMLHELGDDPDIFLCVSFNGSEHKISIVQVEPGGRLLKPYYVQEEFGEDCEDELAYSTIEVLYESHKIISFGLVKGWGELYRPRP